MEVVIATAVDVLFAGGAVPEDMVGATAIDRLRMPKNGMGVVPDVIPNKSETLSFFFKPVKGNFSEGVDPGSLLGGGEKVTGSSFRDDLAALSLFAQRLYMDLEESAFFNMDSAVPLGIIVNELVLNSLKHAFGENQEGEIRILLCREEMNHEISKPFFSLKISDNGKGIPENIDLERAESLGLQLVNILVDQLEGNIKLTRNQGTEFRITFSVEESP